MVVLRRALVSPRLWPASTSPTSTMGCSTRSMPSSALYTAPKGYADRHLRRQVGPLAEPAPRCWGGRCGEPMPLLAALGAGGADS